MEAINLAYNPAGLRVATAEDEKFVIHLQKQHSEALGFLPREAVKTYIAAGRVLLGQENDCQAGYILGRPKMRYDPRIAPITQCAVSMDLKRRHLGLGMVDAWATAAFLDGKKCVQCWCADDLDASLFWPAAGFTAIARRWPKNTRARSLTLWRRACSLGEMGDDLYRLPPLAGFKATKVGRIESLIDGRFNQQTTDSNQRPADSQLFLFDILADDGRLAFMA